MLFKNGSRRAATTTLTQHILLYLQQLNVVVNSLRVNKSSTHADMTLLSEEFLYTSEIITFKSTQWLP